MKNQILYILLVLSVLSIGCKETKAPTTQTPATQNQSPDQQNTEKTDIQPPADPENSEEPSTDGLGSEPIDGENSELVGRLRKQDATELGKLYQDTIEFVGYNYDADDFFLIGKKEKKEIWLIFRWDSEDKKYQFKHGDLLKIEWRMDTIRPAGDEEFLDYVEVVEEATKINSNSSEIKFLWWEERYIEELEGDYQTIILNDDFCQSISDQEKAALGFVATFVGNECQWDGKANADRSNLKCKILTALDLGYQCSDDHLGFLRKWFANDTGALKKLTSCGTMPYTATSQNTFDEIFVTSTENTIQVRYKVQGVNTAMSTSWSWNQLDYFTYDQETITLMQSQKSAISKEKMK